MTVASVGPYVLIHPTLPPLSFCQSASLSPDAFSPPTITTRRLSGSSSSVRLNSVTHSCQYAVGRSSTVNSSLSISSSKSLPTLNISSPRSTNVPPLNQVGKSSSTAASKLIE